MAIEDFANGANILQQVDVSQIFKSLAMGIAEAQQELDDNSISQLERLSETELAGKSLLELGFVPAFYSFTYADISASIHLRMAEKTSFSLGFEASFEYDSNSSASGNFSELNKELQFKSEQGEFKSNRAFSIKSSSKQQFKINNQYYKLDETEDVVSRHAKMQKELREDAKIDRVNMQYSNSYYTVFQNVSNYSLAILTDLSSGGNDLTTPAVTIASQSFATIYAAMDTAVSSQLYGFSGDDVYGLTPSPTKMDLYFDTDVRTLDFAYDLTLKGIANKAAAFQALATALKNDPQMHITIQGSCDRTAGTEYNLNLSTGRCISMRDWLVAKGAGKTQIHIDPEGEALAAANGDTDGNPNADFRRIRISVIPNRHYIYCVTNITMVVGGTGGNSCVNVPTASSATFVVVNGSSAGFLAGTDMATYESLNAGSSNSLYESETRENIHYFLHKDTEVTYMVYSEDSETIDISAEQGSQSEVKVYKNESSTERIKNLAEKNNSNKTFAASASVDIRYARQFEMSIEGSASMSAHMVAVPPPAQFITHISTAFNNEETE